MQCACHVDVVEQQNDRWIVAHFRNYIWKLEDTFLWLAQSFAMWAGPQNLNRTYWTRARQHHVAANALCQAKMVRVDAPYAW